MSKIVTMTCQLKNRQTIWYHMMIYVHICPTRNGVSPREEKLSGFFRWPPGPAIEPLGRWCDTKLSWPCTCPPSQSKEVAQQIDRRRGKSTNRGDVMGFLLTNQHVKIVRQIWCERLKRHQKFRSTSAANIGNCVLPFRTEFQCHRHVTIRPFWDDDIEWISAVVLHQVGLWVVGGVVVRIQIGRKTCGVRRFRRSGVGEPRVWGDEDPEYH